MSVGNKKGLTRNAQKTSTKLCNKLSKSKRKKLLLINKMTMVMKIQNIDQREHVLEELEANLDRSQSLETLKISLYDRKSKGNK